MSTLRAPVVFILFNRPAPTRAVFERIRDARPSRLLLIADGPRQRYPEDETRCKQAREIAQNITWPCELSTNFSESNLGCRRRVISGLDWAFSQVEEAIILEDDCLPDTTFFPFCQEMLARYRDDMRVGMVSGNNFVAPQRKTSYSYYFSRLAHIWGWATWRSTWKLYDENLKDWEAIKRGGILREIFTQQVEIEYWTRTFDSMYRGTGPNTWDIQLAYSILINNMLCVVPEMNLVRNIGFGPNATHTLDLSPPAAVGSASPMTFPIRHPGNMVPLRGFDELEHRTLNAQSLYADVGRLARRLIPKNLAAATRRAVRRSRLVSSLPHL